MDVNHFFYSSQFGQPVYRSTGLPVYQSTGLPVRKNTKPSQPVTQLASRPVKKNAKNTGYKVRVKKQNTKSVCRSKINTRLVCRPISHPVSQSRLKYKQNLKQSTYQILDKSLNH